VSRFYLNGFTAHDSVPGQEPYVWLASLDTGVIKRRSPKNISIVSGYYDDSGGLEEPAKTIESHLNRVETAAAAAIRRFVAVDISRRMVASPQIFRFLAWQAARTPGMMELEQEWANDWDPCSSDVLAEPPPEGLSQIKNRFRPLLLEDPTTGQTRDITDGDEFNALRRLGWKWVFRRDDMLECMHMQAWYFQVRHFPRLDWTRLDAPPGECFVTSDRAVTWMADGFIDQPPAALRHSSAQLVATLTRRTALVGRRRRCTLNVSPREINRFVAVTASKWLAGPTKSALEQALTDRAEALA